jgi:hypothetical protein
MPKEIRTKKKCCDSGPRCKRCPVALKRLEKAGLAKRFGRRTWILTTKPSKKQMRAARARG